MKMSFIFSLLLTSSAWAQMIFPQVYNSGMNVQVQVHNTTPKMIQCSGPVMMQLENGQSEHQYFFDSVMAYGFIFRSLYPRSIDTRIAFVNHSIYCR